MRSVEAHNMNLPICSRTGDVIEYLPKEQWFLSCSELNKLATQVVKDGKLKIEPEKFVKNWLDWTNDDRDWCISRQLWWGHQIPAYKCSVGKDLIWTAATDEKTAKLQASKFLRTIPDDITAERDTDVLDTWFSSGIYPFAALGWPENSKDLKRFYPLDLMVTGHDILGFWVHRMVILGLKMTDKLPFNDVLLHGVICDNKGAKMSKSRGNVIDPIDVIDGITLDKLKEKAVSMHKEGILNKDELKKAVAYHKSNFSTTNGIPQCGVDALRFTLLSQDIGSHFVNFDVNQCHANKLFCNKIWQSVKYTQLSFDKLKPVIDRITLDDLTFFDKWILSRLADMVETVEKAMDGYQFHTAVKSLRTMLYNEFCDVYLEATKPGFEDDNFKIGYAHAHCLSAVLNTSLRCLAPFMIYITEELISKIPAFETNIIHNFNDTDNLELPKGADFRMWHNKNLEIQVDKLLNTIYLIREVKGLYNISNKLKPLVYITSKDDELLENIKRNSKIVLNLSRCSRIKFEEVNDKNTINASLDKDTEIRIELEGNDIDNILTAAKTRISKRVKKIEESIEKLKKRVTSEKYLSSVAENDQNLDKERLLEKQEELKRLQRLI
ncbi:probable valine--tRNA ligase, cytoplasmic [Aricia agestis]|uniref:probable valine--tRNA ligase, cytoplasmic n=1 Tax=Aricia agestis TaxID=91739 RepID=UPI001C20A1A0|nr:probable valine--tRNA ligase, cytoplasmic [Aricia agestis]